MKRNPKTKTVSCAFDRETWRAFEQLTRVMGLSGPQGLRELVTYAVQNTSFEDRRGKGPFSPTTLAYGAATVRANMPKPEPAPAKPSKTAVALAADKPLQRSNEGPEGLKELFDDPH